MPAYTILVNTLVLLVLLTRQSSGTSIGDSDSWLQLPLLLQGQAFGAVVDKPDSGLAIHGRAIG